MTWIKALDSSDYENQECSKKNLSTAYTLSSAMNEFLLLKKMRAVDMSLHRVVKCGVSWPFSFQPNSKNMILQLERNEALVTWLEPLESDDISKQFPAIRVRDQYYTMSLRMMKVSDLSPRPTSRVA
jgi:hypothetical protein